MLGPERPRVRKSSFHSTRRCSPLDGSLSLRSLTLPSGWLFSFHTQMVLDGRCSLIPQSGCLLFTPPADAALKTSLSHSNRESQMLPSGCLFLTPLADAALWMSLFLTALADAMSPSHSNRRCCPLDVSFSLHSQMLPSGCLFLIALADVALPMSLSHSTRRCCPLDVSFHSTRKCCPLDVSFTLHSQMLPSCHLQAQTGEGLGGARRLNLYRIDRRDRCSFRAEACKNAPQFKRGEG